MQSLRDKLPMVLGALAWASWPFLTWRHDAWLVLVVAGLVISVPRVAAGLNRKVEEPLGAAWWIAAGLLAFGGLIALAQVKPDNEQREGSGINYRGAPIDE